MEEIRGFQNLAKNSGRGGFLQVNLNKIMWRNGFIFGEMIEGLEFGVTEKSISEAAQ